MRHSFVVGVAPEGQRQPLFVGTIGEARSFADAAKSAGGVVEKTPYRRIDICEGIDPTHVMEFPAPSAETARHGKNARAGGPKSKSQKNAAAPKPAGDGEQQKSQGDEEDSGV